MLSPLIPDTRHPKWSIVVKLLEIIASPRARKIAGRLKISGVNNFLISIKVLILADLFERDISRLVSEVKRRRRTRAASCGASEAPPHDNGTMLANAFPKPNVHARCPNRSEKLSMSSLFAVI
jgi:hypothetical protein